MVKNKKISNCFTPKYKLGSNENRNNPLVGSIFTDRSGGETQAEMCVIRVYVELSPWS